MNTTKGLDVETSNIGSPKRKLKARWTHEAQQDLDMMHRGPRKNAIVRAWQAFCEGNIDEVSYVNREDTAGIYLTRPADTRY